MSSRSADVVQQVAVRGVLHGDRKVGGREEAVAEPDDVRMYEHGVIDNLPLHVLGYLSLCDSRRQFFFLDAAAGLSGNPVLDLHSPADAP